MRYILYIAFIISFVIVVAGCTSDNQPPQNAEARREARKKAKEEKNSAPEVAVVEKSQSDKEPYSYTSAGKPDPFVPLIADILAKSKTEASSSRDKEYLTPLQKYELKDLKLVAVVVSDNEPTAMLEDPTGYGYFVRKGMLVGPNDGVVERVIPNGLIIKEKFYNSLGEEEPKISTLTIDHVE
jgi:type IV pilus assembly protein PilP